MTTSNDTQNPRWASRRDAANYAGISTRTLDRWTRAGIIPAHTIGGTIRIDLRDIDAAIWGDAA